MKNKIFSSIILALFLLMTSCLPLSIFNKEAISKSDFSEAKVITGQDTIVGKFREVPRGIEQHFNNNEKYIYYEPIIDYVDFDSFKFPFAKVEYLVNMNEIERDEFTNSLLNKESKDISQWFEIIIEGEIGLYKRYYLVYNANYTPTVDYFHVLRMNNKLFKISRSSIFVNREKKSLQDIFKNHPKVLVEIEYHYKNKDLQIDDFIKLLNTEVGQKLLSQK